MSHDITSAATPALTLAKCVLFPTKVQIAACNYRKIKFLINEDFTLEKFVQQLKLFSSTSNISWADTLNISCLGQMYTFYHRVTFAKDCIEY